MEAQGGALVKSEREAGFLPLGFPTQIALPRWSIHLVAQSLLQGPTSSGSMCLGGMKSCHLAFWRRGKRGTHPFEMGR